MSQVSNDIVLIVANPKSGASSSLARVKALDEQLQNQGLKSIILTDLVEIERDSKRHHAEGNLRCVVSAGGDGTVALLANLLDPGIALQLMPMGTENLLAKHLGITNDVQAVCRAIRQNKTTHIDVGLANGRLFLVMASCGFDAEVVRQMHAVRKGHINRWSYAGPIIKGLRKYGFPKLKVRSPASGLHDSNGAAWLFAFNVPRYAANLKFCPQADPSDGLLDLCSFERPGIFFGLGYFLRLWLQTHQSMKGFQHVRFDKIEIPAPVDQNGKIIEDIPYQVDGDPGGVLPLVLETVPNRLKLVVP